MAKYKARYGFEPRTVQSLYEYYWRRGGMGVMDHGWESFDDFVKWCSVSGYRKNYHLNRLDPTKPHGPENSFWDRTLLERPEKRLRHREKTRVKPAVWSRIAIGSACPVPPGGT